MENGKKATRTTWCASDVMYWRELKRLEQAGGKVIKETRDLTVVELEDAIVTVILDETDVRADIGYTGR